MEATNYTSIGPVLQLNKAGELTQKRIKAVKVCDGLYITEPDKSNFVRFIIECNGVMWVESSQSKSYVNRYAAMMPEVIKKVKAGFYGGENCNNFCREIDRRINHPEAPAIMELKKPERKKPEPLPEGAKKVSVYMCKGCTAETTDKKVVITEIAPHVYTYVYKLKKYGERVKVVFEIDGVYFEAVDKGACYMERKDFAEVCTKAYASARKNIAGGAAQGMPYFVEVQKRIDAATPTETPQISMETAETVNVSAEGEKAAETKEMPRYECPNYADYAFERGWSIENTDFDPHSGVLCMIHFDPSDEKYVCGCLWQINSDKPNYTEHRRFKTLKGAQNYGTKRMGMKLEYQTLTVYCPITPTEPPQSPETPQTVDCIADTPKSQETARKRPNRAIGSAQHHQYSALGANGYSVLNDASVTMTAMNVRRDTLRDTLHSVTYVPRECSTANTPPYW